MSSPYPFYFYKSISYTSTPCLIHSTTPYGLLLRLYLPPPIGLMYTPPYGTPIHTGTSPIPPLLLLNDTPLVYLNINVPITLYTSIPITTSTTLLSLFISLSPPLSLVLSLSLFLSLSLPLSLSYPPLYHYLLTSSI